MYEDHRLLTPENVELQYAVAGIGSRLAAALVDYMVVSISLTVSGVGLSLLGTTLLGAAGHETLARNIAIIGLVVVGVILIFATWWGYFSLFELLWNGQTPGKRLLHLRVVRLNGQPITLLTTLIRNLLRAIDLPLLIGVLVMLVDRRSRRLGDFAAGTLVIREAHTTLTELGRATIPQVSAQAVDAFPAPALVTSEHHTLIRDFFQRMSRLDTSTAERLGNRLAIDLARDLGIDPPRLGQTETFLATAARAYESRRRPS